MREVWVWRLVPEGRQGLSGFWRGFRFPWSQKNAKSEEFFFSRLRTSVNTKNSRLTREIPLVPRVKTSPSDPRAKRSLRTSRVPSKQKANEKQNVRKTKLNATKLVYLFHWHLQAIFLQSPLPVVFFGAFTVFSAARQVRASKTQCLHLPTFTQRKS